MKLTYTYIVVASKTVKVLMSTLDYYEAVRYAGVIRRGGGEVLIFKSTRA